eukprot:g3700.t1
MASFFIEKEALKRLTRAVGPMPPAERTKSAITRAVNVLSVKQVRRDDDDDDDDDDVGREENSCSKGDEVNRITEHESIYPGGSYFLTFAVNDYSTCKSAQKKLSNLDGAVADAIECAQELRKDGFQEVASLQNAAATAQNIRNAIEKLVRQTRGNFRCRIAVHFAMHGFIEETTAEGWLVPSNADLQCLSNTCVPLG